MDTLAEGLPESARIMVEQVELVTTVVALAALWQTARDMGIEDKLEAKARKWATRNRGKIKPVQLVPKMVGFLFEAALEK